MNRTIILPIAIVVSIGAVWIVSPRGFAERRFDSVHTLAARSQAPANTVPEHVIYRMLFHHVHVLQDSATEAEQRGNYHSALAYRRAAFAADAQLNEEQTQTLFRVAEACELAVSTIDQR